MAVHPTLVVNAAAARAIHRGHPWVWRESLDRQGKRPAAGSSVRLRDRAGELLGHGIYDDESPIAVRVWTREDQPVTQTLIEERLLRALRLRLRAFDATTTAYRIAYGEGDALPGIVIDRYADVAVVKPDGQAATELVRRHADAIGAILRGQLGIRAAILRGRSGAGRATLFGELATSEIAAQEHGVPLLADVESGQKTGAFLDQRENRRFVGGIARGRRVLNLFAYASGFSIHAALGGARHATSVDIAPGAHRMASAAMRLAGVDSNRIDLVTADVFQFLSSARATGQTWELIVCDPPSFAPSERALARALSAYRRLHAACVDVLEPGGTFCASSCSSHVTEGMFIETLEGLPKRGPSLRIISRRGLPADHPTSPAWTEGRYLKFVVLE